MARVDTLNNYLTDISSAIKQKRNITENIPAKNFDEEILKIETDSGTGLNVFAQLEEPETKDGVWIKTERTMLDKSTCTQLADTPYQFKYGSAVAINTDIYLLGSSYGGGYYEQHKYAYKYDTLTNTYTKLTNIPYEFCSNKAVAVETDIYLFGSNDYYGNYLQYAYKYDTLTDTYTQLANIPYKYYSNSTVAIGTNIYLLGCRHVYDNDNPSQKVYKYDITTDTYVELKALPYTYQYGYYYASAVAIGTDIQIYLNKSTTYYTLKYDTMTDTYTELMIIPYIYMWLPIVIGTDVFLFDDIYIYKHNTLTNTFIRFLTLPFTTDNSDSLVLVGTNTFYIFGIGSSYYNAYKGDMGMALPELSKYEYKGVKLFDVTVANDYEELPKLSNGSLSLTRFSAIPVGAKIYLISGGDYYGHIYEYDTLENSSTLIYESERGYFYNGETTALVGTTIYIFAAREIPSTTVYKYDTLTNSFAGASSLPFNMCGYGSTVVIGTDIYLIAGQYNSGGKAWIYKYDTLVGTYTKIVDFPVPTELFTSILIEGDIYIFTQSNNTRNAFKYNISTNTFTTITAHPVNLFNNSVSLIKSDIYLFGMGNSNQYYNAYKYNITTDTYTQLKDSPIALSDFAAALVGNNIYIFCGNYIYKYMVANIENKYIYIQNKKNNYITNLSELLLTSFDNAFIYDDSEIKSYPCYYGDGEKWNLLKN